MKRYEGWRGWNGTGEKGGALAQSGVVGRQVCIEGVFNCDFLLFLCTLNSFNRDIVCFCVSREIRFLSVSRSLYLLYNDSKRKLIMPVDEIL